MSLVLPHMDYCSLVYSNTTEHNLNQLQLVQNAACRAILQADRRTHIIDMHTELNIPSIRDRLDFQLSLECFKQVNNSGSLSHLFIPKDTGRTTRSTNTKIMNVPRVRTNLGKYAFGYKGPNHWNGLNNDARLITNETAFRRTISKLNNRDVDHPT